MRYGGKKLTRRITQRPSRKKDSATDTVKRRFVVYAVLSIFLFGFAKLYSHYYRKSNKPHPDTKITKKINGNLETGALYNVLKENGISESETAAVINSFSKIFNPRLLNSEDKYYISISYKSEFQRLVVTHKLKRYYVAKVANDKYINGEIELKIFEKQKISSGIINNSLWQSMSENSVSPQLIMEFSEVFVWNIDFSTEVRNGDKYVIIWDEKVTETGDVIDQKILAAYYAGKEAGTKKGFLWKSEYYDIKGGALEKMFLRTPLNYKRISSHFSRNRYHPILRIYRAHKGTDYVAPRGTPVSCVAKGKVTASGRKKQIGKYVEIKHDFGYKTVYGHLSKIANGMVKGARVKQSQVIGYVGSTGMASGAHLHFAIKHYNKYFNFVTFKNRSAKGLAKKYLSEFKKIATALNEKIEQQLAAIENSKTSVIDDNSETKVK